jgi:hypothetical protein
VIGLELQLEAALGWSGAAVGQQNFDWSGVSV